MQEVIAGLGSGRTTKIAMTGGAGVAVHRALIGSPNLGPVRTLKSCPQLLYIGSKSCQTVSAGLLWTRCLSHRYAQKKWWNQTHQDL